MSATEVVTVDFHGDTLFAVKRERVVQVALPPICDRLGVQWAAQLKRIKRDSVLSEGMSKLDMPSLGGIQETTVLALDLIPGWLFGIGENQVRPEARETVLLYKRECFAALYRHFHPDVVHTDALPFAERRPFDEWTAAEVNSKIGAVAEYRMSISPQAAQWAMRRFGLPMPPAGFLRPMQYDLDLRPIAQDGR